jgi:hypothetical protein
VSTHPNLYICNKISSIVHSIRLQFDKLKYAQKARPKGQKVFPAEKFRNKCSHALGVQMARPYLVAACTAILGRCGHFSTLPPKSHHVSSHSPTTTSPKHSRRPAQPAYLHCSSRADFIAIGLVRCITNAVFGAGAVWNDGRRDKRFDGCVDNLVLDVYCFLWKTPNLQVGLPCTLRMMLTAVL